MSQNRKTILSAFFCTNLILRVFHGLFTDFSLSFSWPFHVFFHGVTIFANLEVAPSIFPALDFFGDGALLN